MVIFMSEENEMFLTQYWWSENLDLFSNKCPNIPIRLLDFSKFY